MNSFKKKKEIYSKRKSRKFFKDKHKQLQEENIEQFQKLNRNTLKNNGNSF
jgi:hypothetical protein